MPVLILSDIHANIDALDAVLAAAPPFDAVWNLGDIVGYGAAPNETVERCRALGGAVVRGNHDRACGGLLAVDDFSPAAAQAVLWTREKLTRENVDWLRQLARGPVRPEGADALCAHGSPLDEDEYLFSLDEARLPLRLSPGRIHFIGHTHLQGGFATNSYDWFNIGPQYARKNGADSSELILRSGVRYILNPGSVGQPRDGDWRSAFALYDADRQMLEFHRVPYDLHRAQRRILDAGLPDTLALRLRVGV